MPYLIENIIATATLLIIVGLIVIGAFILTAIHRRLLRERYFRQLDRARAELRTALAPFFAGEMPLDKAVAVLAKMRSAAERRAAEEVVLEHAQADGQLVPARELVERLGWQKEWIDTLRCRSRKPSERNQKLIEALGDKYRRPGGLALPLLQLRSSFLKRCRAAQNLSGIPSVQGMFALLAGLTDPHRDVQELCVRKLGVLADPATLPILFGELIDVLEGRHRLSVRTLKSALVRFSLRDVDAFRAGLTHPKPRVRFFATDIVREIVERRRQSERLGKNDFTPDVYRLFTEKLVVDSSDDVRARAAVVVAYFYDLDCNPMLTKLLQDPVWFVRLHACRALGEHFFLPLAPQVAECLTDSNWLVREAAVRSLCAMGDPGIAVIMDSFINVSDRYAAEQIAEEIQRNGLIEQALLYCKTLSELEQARLLTRRMVMLSKTSMLQAYLMGPIPYELKSVLISEMSGSQEVKCHETLKACAERDPDPRVRTLATTAVRAAVSRSGTVAGASG